jgi:hypothetical protein
MRLVILNCEEEFRNYAENHRQSNDIILPISPTVRHLAARKSWEIRTLQSLWNEKDYFIAKTKSEDRIKNLICDLNTHTKSLAKNFPLNIGDYFHFQLHIVIGQIHYNWFLIEMIMKNLQPSSWLIYQNWAPSLFMGFRPDPDTIFQKILLRTKHAEKCTVLEIKSRKNTSEKKTFRHILIHFLPIGIIDSIRNYLQKYKSGHVFNTGGKSTFTILGSPYDWFPLIKHPIFMKRYFVDFFSASSMESVHKYDKNLMQIINRSIMVDNLLPLDLTEQVKIIQGTLLEMDSKVELIFRKLKKTKAILSSVYVYPWQNFVGHLASELKLPIINWQHGEMNLYNDIFTESVETRYTTHYLCYGESVAPKYEAFIGRSPMQKVFAVGSTKKRINWKANQQILYATGKWMKTATPFTEAQDPDTRLYNAQEDILGYLETLSDEHEIIFKGNNTPGLNEEVFKIKKIVFEAYKPFISLLETAKLVILDTPATTCLETCSIPVPLFILTGRNNWYENPTRLLEKRAVLANTTEELIEHVANYLKHGTYNADIYNKEFLNEYGSKYTSEQSIVNALNALEEIIV